MDYRGLAEEYMQIMCGRPHGPKKDKIPDALRGEMAVLRFLREVHHPATPSELSCDRKLSTARIANTLASMEKKGWIKRIPDSSDRRKVLVYLTEAGMTRAEKGHQDALKDMESMLRWLGEADAKAFVRIQRRINELMLSGWPEVPDTSEAAQSESSVQNQSNQ